MITLNSIVTGFVNPAVKVLLALAVLYFVYGVFVFVKNSESPEGIETGRNHLIYASLGLFIMISVGGIMYVIQNSFH